MPSKGKDRFLPRIVGHLAMGLAMGALLCLAVVLIGGGPVFSGPSDGVAPVAIVVFSAVVLTTGVGAALTGFVLTAIYGD